MDDLWPDDVVIRDMKPPVGILREQAAFLGEKTEKGVTGNVRSMNTSDDAIVHSFEVMATESDNFAYKLFTVKHKLADFYPLEMVRFNPREEISVSTEAAFLEKLKEIFHAAETRRIISNLMAQNQE